jgi:probable rRNA maturation factor
MVLIRSYQRLLKIDTRTLARIVGEVVPTLGIGDRDTSILLVDDRRITEFNRRFFDRDKATNVISFSYLSGYPTELAGEIIVSVETALSEAKGAGIPIQERLLALIAHGLLHVLGFDHEKGSNESRRMGRREKKLLGAFLANPLYARLAIEPRKAVERKK